jgi:hypothetical protein
LRFRGIVWEEGGRRWEKVEKVENAEEVKKVEIEYQYQHLFCSPTIKKSSKNSMLDLDSL